jgi:hypothetical protein
MVVRVGNRIAVIEGDPNSFGVIDWVGTAGP